jgi:hypothetical protein
MPVNLYLLNRYYTGSNEVNGGLAFIPPLPITRKVGEDVCSAF